MKTSHPVLSRNDKTIDGRDGLCPSDSPIGAKKKSFTRCSVITEGLGAGRNAPLGTTNRRRQDRRPTTKDKLHTSRRADSEQRKKGGPHFEGRSGAMSACQVEVWRDPKVCPTARQEVRLFKHYWSLLSNLVLLAAGSIRSAR